MRTGGLASTAPPSRPGAASAPRAAATASRAGAATAAARAGPAPPDARAAGTGAGMAPGLRARRVFELSLTP